MSDDHLLLCGKRSCEEACGQNGFTGNAGGDLPPCPQGIVARDWRLDRLKVCIY